MSPNSCSLFSRPWALIRVRKRLSGSGSAPSWPAETCTFCSRIARTTSLAVRPREATLPGSSQARMA